MKYIVFILFTVMTNAAAQLMLKQGMMSLGQISFEGTNPLLKLLQIVFSPWVFLSLAYVAVAIFAYFVFREDLNGWRIAGIAFICIGTVLIAQSGRGHDEETASLSSDKIHSGIVR